jgi:ABC-type phosphate/phosphonate transport system substrate-binding protein
MTRLYPTFGLPHRRFVSLVLALSAPLGVAAVVAHGRPEKSDVLRIGLSGPLGSDTEGPKEKAVAAMMQAFIKSETGMNDEIVCQKDWRDLADKLSKGQLQVGVFQGYEFAWAQEQHPSLKPLALALTGPRNLTACVVARRDGKAKQFDDLRGQSLGLPDIGQRHLRLFVERESQARGAEPDAFFSKISSPQNVEDCLDDVVDGTVQAAVVDHAALEAYKRRKPGRFNKLKGVAKSRPLPPIVVAFCDNVLDEPTVRRFREGLVESRNKERGRMMLTVFRLTAFEVAPNNFEKVLAETRKAYPSPKAEMK